MNTDSTFRNTKSAKGTRQNRLLLNLGAKEKNALKTGSIGLGGFIAGVGVLSLFGPSRLSAATSVSTDIDAESDADLCLEENELNLQEDMLNESNTVSIETSISVASIDDSLDFNDAFAQAREDVGAGGFFEWRGNSYNTYYKEEWDALGSEGQDEFITTVAQQTDVNTISDYSDTGVTTEYEVLDNLESTTETVSVQEVSSIEESTPEMGFADMDNDGIVDSVSLDSDHDGYADVIVFDSNKDGKIDGLLIDDNLDGDLDVLVIDEGQDGFDDNDPYEEYEGVVSMDKFIIVEEDETLEEAIDTHDSNDAVIESSDYNEDNDMDDLAETDSQFI